MEIEFQEDFPITPHEVIVKWQPVTLILSNGRLECSCGNQAIFVIGELPGKERSSLMLDGVRAYCQECYESELGELDDPI